MSKNIKTDYGAIGNGVADDTSAFQAAINDIVAGNVGMIDIPVGSYVVKALNGTGLQAGIFAGEGQGSKIIVSGKDTAGNWFDLCGANNVSFRDLLIVNDGATIPQVLFPWLQTSASGVLAGLSFENVNISANTNLSLLFGYGFGNVGQGDRGGSLSIRDCMWEQIGNASVFYSGNTSTPYLRNSVMQLTAKNSAGVTSANVTVHTGASRAWGATLDNLYAIDNAAGYGGTGSTDHNSGIILENVTNLIANGGAIQSLSDASLILWADCQGLQFNTVQFMAADGGSGHVNRFVWSGGGLNSFVAFINPLWSDPSQAFVDFAPGGVGAASGGGWYWSFLCNDVAGNGAVPFIANIYGGGSWVASNPWLKNCLVQTYVATTVNCPGSVDSHTIFQGPVSVSVAAGASDASHHF